MATNRTEEYLESIFKLQQASQPVATSKLAEHLGLSAPAVSEMIRKLEQSGLIHHTEKGVYLTKKGEKAAGKVVRRHRLSERLLTDFLGCRWDEVHDEACRLEHAISPELEERIAKSLGQPTTCPHGHPIPSKNGTFKTEPTKPLSELEASEKSTIVSVFEEDPRMLQYLATLGLMPGASIEILEKAPFNGPITLKVGATSCALGHATASIIQVKQTK